MSDRAKLLIIWLIIIAAVLFLHGCSVEKKAQRKTAWLISRDKLDDICARVYPPRDSFSVKDSILFDTLYMDNNVIIRDTVKCKDTVIYLERRCPPSERIIIHHYHDSIIYRSNTAEEDRLKGEIITWQKGFEHAGEMILDLNNELKEQRGKRDWWMWAFLILAGVNVIGLVFRFFILKRPL